MKCPSILLVGIISICMPNVAQSQDHHARGLVIQALALPNQLSVSGGEFETKPNPRGEGVFVFHPRTRFGGVQRYLIWLVVKDKAYPLNGPSKTLTPSLKWPREAASEVWQSTGLDPYMPTEAIAIVFGEKEQ